MDRVNGSTDLLDMAFISPNLAKHDIQFQIGDDLGSDTYPSKSQLMLHHIGIHILTTPLKYQITTRGCARFRGFLWTYVH